MSSCPPSFPGSSPTFWSNNPFFFWHTSWNWKGGGEATAIITVQIHGDILGSGISCKQPHIWFCLIPRVYNIMLAFCYGITREFLHSNKVLRNEERGPNDTVNRSSINIIIKSFVVLLSSKQIICGFIIIHVWYVIAWLSSWISFVEPVSFLPTVQFLIAWAYCKLSKTGQLEALLGRSLKPRLSVPDFVSQLWRKPGLYLLLSTWVDSFMW